MGTGVKKTIGIKFYPTYDCVKVLSSDDDRSLYDKIIEDVDLSKVDGISSDYWKMLDGEIVPMTKCEVISFNMAKYGTEKSFGEPFFLDECVYKIVENVESTDRNFTKLLITFFAVFIVMALVWVSLRHG